MKITRIQYLLSITILGSIILVILPLLISRYPKIEPDMYYHIALGNIIRREGIQTTDPLSFGALKHWFPFEWGFQVLLSVTADLIRIENIYLFVWVFTMIQMTILFTITKKIFSLSSVQSLCVASSFLFLNVASFTPRPQIAAISCLLLQLLLIYSYVYKHKNYLVFTIPITYCLSLFHISVVFIPILLLMYGFLYKKRTLLYFGIAAFIVSFMPPTGLIQYQHLLFILNNKDIIVQNQELQSLIFFPVDLLLYVFTFIFFAIPFFWHIYKRKISIKETIIETLPYFGMVLFGISALRNTDIGHVGIILLFSSFYHKQNLTFKKYFILAEICFIAFLALTAYNRLQNAPTHLPSQAVQYLNTNNLKGNLFHEYRYGGYISYSLYPKYKVFIDGRQDVYAKNVLPDYLALEKNIGTNDVNNKVLIKNILTKYNIDIIMVTYRDNKTGEKILNYIQNNPDWKIVFWNDNEIISVNKQAQFAEELLALAPKYATPFSPYPSVANQEKQALDEYVQFDNQYPSAITKNNIGILLSYTNHKDDAEIYFEKSINTDPELYYAAINLAQLKIQKKDYNGAITILKKALQYNKDKIILYRILAEIYLRSNKKQEARKTILEAFSYNPKPDDSELLKKLLYSL